MRHTPLTDQELTDLHDKVVTKIVGTMVDRPETWAAVQELVNAWPRVLEEIRAWRRASAAITNIGPERGRALLFEQAVMHVGPPPGMKPIKE